MDGLSPPDLANSVTAFCTILAGVVTMLLTRLVAPQPAHWRRVYLFIFLTGLPTLGWHGWGGELWRVADTGSNLVLAWTLQLAALADFYPTPVQRAVGGASAVINLLGIAWMAWEGVSDVHSYAIDLGSFGGFYVGEALLILDSVTVVGLIYARHDRIPAAAKPLLRLVVVFFLVGLGLASAAGDVVHGRVWSYHALWHVVGAYGFIFLWAFNHVRFAAPQRSPARPQATTAQRRR